MKNREIVFENEQYKVLRLCFQKKEKTIYGELYYPKSTKDVSLVIIGHGFGETYKSTSYSAKRFVEEGIAAYVFDYCGGSPSSRSDGKTTSMSVLTEQEDMETILNAFQECSFINSDSIYLMGESQGGFVAALLAANRDDVKGLILFYPALVIPDDARHLFAKDAQIQSTNWVFGIPVGRKYYADVLHMDAYQEIAGYKGPVLIVHGDRDSIVPISYAKKAKEVYQNAQVHILQGSGHGFCGKALEHACNLAIQFVQKQ